MRLAVMREERQKALERKKQEQAIKKTKKNDKKQLISTAKVALSSEAQNGASGGSSAVRTFGRKSKPSQRKLGLDLA